VILALTVAGLVNMAMVIMASGAFHEDHTDVGEIQTPYHTLAPLLGIAAASVFLVSLIASGVSSSVVGTMAGQVIMQGFVGFRIPIWVRRAVTMIPAFAVMAMGYNATESLIISQVVLSIALPFPMIALVVFTRRLDVMSEFANSQLTDLTAWVATAVRPSSMARSNAQRTHTGEFHEVRPFAAWTVDAINREAHAWERVYNTIRPHQALGLPNSPSVPPRPARRRPRS
jgi:hypothetical protein